MKMYLPISLTIVAGAGIAAFCYYRRNRKKSLRPLTNELDQSEIQRVDVLLIENILNWVNISLDDLNIDSSDLELNVFPNTATIETLGGKLKLNKKDSAHCYLLFILDNASNNYIKRKLVIANKIGEGLEAVQHGKIYAIKLK